MWDFLTKPFEPPSATKANLIIRGRPGTCKTSFLLSNKDTLTTSYEAQGADWVVGKQGEFELVQDWETFNKLMTLLEKDAKDNGDARRFWAVGIDTAAQWLDKIMFPQWCKLNGVKEVEGFDFAKAAKFAMMYLRKLNQWGYAWHLTDHILDKVISTGTSEKVVTESVLTQSFRKLIDGECSHILTFELRNVTTGPDGRALPVDKRFKECWVTTQPGRRTSLENPKARVWLPQEFRIPSVEVDPKCYGWLAYDQAHEAAVERMKEVNEVALAG